MDGVAAGLIRRLDDDRMAHQADGHPDLAMTANAALDLDPDNDEAGQILSSFPPA